MSNIASTDCRMLTGGEWVAAVEGRVLQSQNPATGEAWSTIPDAGATDVEAIREVTQVKRVWVELSETVRDPFVLRV
jgi:acyl-CoA reductase-like NAD-dependent aldehyde dehydrogenase